MGDADVIGADVMNSINLHLSLRSAALGLVVTCAVLMSACAPHPVTVQDIHELSLVLDAHADVVIPDATGQYLGRDGRSKVAVEKLKAGGVDAVILSLAVPPGATRSPEDDSKGRALSDQKLSVVNDLIEKHGDDVVLATSSQKIGDDTPRVKSH